jgi:hypothetical protein
LDDVTTSPTALLAAPPLPSVSRTTGAAAVGKPASDAGEGVANVPPVRRSPKTARGPASKRKRAGTQDEGASGGDCSEEAEDDIELSTEAIDGFIEDLFDEYAGTADNKGRPLMNNPALRCFFKDFGVKNTASWLVQADLRYADEIERQIDLSFRFDLSKAEARRGLCLKSFTCLLDQLMPRGASRNFAKKRFHQYAGSARNMRMALSGSSF